MKSLKTISFNSFCLNLSKFSIFSFLWAFQTIQEEVDQSIDPAGFAIVLCAAILILIPRSALVFVLFCLLNINNFLAHSPFVVNHYIPLILIYVGLLFLFIKEFVKTSNIEQIDKDAILEQISPTIRWLVCIMYYFAAFHKLNWGFFDTNNSCYVYIYQMIQSVLPIIPNLSSWAINVGIPATILLEAGIPTLLLYRKTRPLGLLVGIVFHLFLGLGFPSFSTTIFVLYLFFLPKEVFDRLHELFLRSRTTRKVCRWLPLFTLLSLLLLWCFPLWFFSRKFAYLFRHLTWFGLFVGLFLISLFFARKLSLSSFTAPISLYVKPQYWILVVLLVINGMSPYLGFKLAPTFSMYSNLMTEASYHNHMLVPKSIQIVNYQDDLVEILESNYPPLEEIAKRKDQIPFVILQRMISSNVSQQNPNDISLVYRRGGKIFSYENAKNDPLLSKKQSWLFKKFTNFRFVPSLGKNRCQW
jgi:hypothetical protein